jgi:hypothetical protein
MRMMLALLCLSAGFALAQTKPTHENAAPESYPVWWETGGRLGLAKLEDAAASFAEPFSKDDLDSLRRLPNGYSGPPRPEVHNCKELLALIDPNDYHSPKRVEAWGMIGSRCAELRELAHAVPARRSAIPNSVWTPAVVSLLPSGIFAAYDEKSRQASMEANKKGLSLRQYWEQVAAAEARQNGKGPKGPATDHRFSFIEEGLIISLGPDLRDDSEIGVCACNGDGYSVVARGDFDGDGWEDILIEAGWSFYRSPLQYYAVYLLTRKSEDGRFEIVKQVF